MEKKQEKTSLMSRKVARYVTTKPTPESVLLLEPTSTYTLLLAVIVCGFILLENSFPDFTAWLASLGVPFAKDFEFFPEASKTFVSNFIEWFGVIYGFLMPLILVRAWEQFDCIDREYDREVDTIKIMYEDILLLHKSNTRFRNKVFRILADYISHVLKFHEAEAGNKGSAREDGDAYLKQLRIAYYGLLHPSGGNKKETDSLSSEMLQQLNKLIDVRGDRISLSNQRLFESLRFVSLLTSVIFVIPFYFAKFYHQEYGFLDSFLVIGVIFLAIFILTTIEDLDEPFTGSWRVSLEPWRRLRKEIESNLPKG